MYWQILKKDLKRKKEMNVILLVFIILASMFVSSGVNNIISVTTALDDYLEMADAPDYIAMTMNKSGDVDIDGILNAAPSVESFGKEKVLYMNNMGEGMRFHEDEEINYIQAQGAFYSQIKFTDAPDKKEITRRMEKIQELYPEFYGVKNCAECISNMLKVTDTLDTVKRMVAVLTVIFAALITVLMERSFIVKEQGEIALMKAIGTRNGKIYAYHTLRFVLVGSLTVIAAELFALPLTHLFIDPIFKMMGMELAVDYVISPFEMFLVFPLVILAATMISAFLASLYTKRIKSLDTANIE